MTKRTLPTLHVATLIDAHGHRHIAAVAACAALCGALGAFEGENTHDVETLCQRCREKRGRMALETALTRMGL
jgi:hypothetical protein